MKLMKKTLAVLLAVIMLFSTASVAFAASGNPDPANRRVEFAFKFFRRVNGEWVETKRAKPGELLIGRFYIGTNFDACSPNMYTMYDHSFLDTPLERETVIRSFEIDGEVYDVKDENSKKYLTGRAFVSQYPEGFELYYSHSNLAKELGLGEGLTEEEAAAKIQEKYTSIRSFATTNKVKEHFDINNFAVQYPMTVQDNEYVRTNKTTNYIVPAEYVVDYRDEKIDNFTDIYIWEPGTTGVSMDSWPYIPIVETCYSPLSVDSNIIFNANGGSFADNSDTVTVNGIIGDAFDTASVPAIATAPNKRTFAGWSTTQNGTPLTAEEMAALEYDYEDITLYAVWERTAPSYVVETYVMNTEGAYPDAPTTSNPFTGTVGQESLDFTPEEMTGFTVDAEASTLHIDFSDDDPNVPYIKVYYNRNKHNIVVKDENGNEIEGQGMTDIYYEAPVSDFNPSYEVPGSEVTFTNDLPDDGKMPDRDVTYTAQVTPIEYHYTFNANDTTNGISAKFSDGNAAKGFTYYYNDVPADPSNDLQVPAGYTFKEWTPAIPENVTGDAEFEAVYEPIKYTLSFEYDGAPEGLTPPETMTDLIVNQEINLPVLPSAEGYTVEGWYNGDNYCTDTFTMPADNAVLTAKFTKNEYSYSFDAGEGKFADGETVKTDKYFYGDASNKHADDIVPPEGWEFTGWEPSVPDTVTSHEKFIATYSPIEYTITYVLESEDIPQEVLQEYTPSSTTGLLCGREVELEPLPQIPGCNVFGWNVVDGEQNVEKIVMPAKHLVIKATVNAIDYTVQFLTGEGKFEDDSTSFDIQGLHYNDETPYPDKEIVPPVGHSFAGWVDEEGSAPAQKVVENKSYTAVYEKLSYKVKFEVEDPNSVATDVPTEMDVLYGEKFYAPGLPSVPDGYEIDGWFIDEETKYNPKDELVMGAGDIVLTAKVSAKTYKVEFDTNGGNEISPREYTFGDKVKDLPTPVKDDHNFVSWSYEGNEITEIESMPAKDIVLVAVWEQIEHTITYKYEGDVPESVEVVPETGRAYANEEITVKPVPAAVEGYTFEGWKLNGTVVESFTMPARDVELIGTWKKNGGNLNFYLAKDEAGNPVGDPYKTEWVDEGDAIVAPETSPERTGFTFKGWVDAEGNALPETMPNGDVNAFAVFEINKYKVTYKDADGTVLKEFTDVPYGSEVPTIDAPTPPEHAQPTMYKYYFKGWNPSVPAEMPDNDLEFVAEYGESNIATEHLATFMSDGKVISQESIMTGDPIPVPENPKKFGYKFVGWNPQVPDVMPDSDVTFEAVWEKDTDFTPVIVGGVVVAGAAIAGIAAVNTAIITGAAIIGGVIVITGIHHVISNSYNVTYRVDGEVYRTFRVVEGTKVIVPRDPSKAGAKFKGWTPEIPDRMPANDLTFDAVWDDSDVLNPETGSVSVGLAAFAAISSAAAAAYIISKKKKEDEE